jgi:hypothetical protein
MPIILPQLTGNGLEVRKGVVLDWSPLFGQIEDVIISSMNELW